jgi:hypothetical protein
MTVIAWDGKSLAADKRIVWGSFAYVGVKLSTFGNWSWATSGDLRDCQEFDKWFKLPEKERKTCWPFANDDDEAKHELCALCVNHITGEALVWDQTSPIPEKLYCPYYAIGSGKQFALAFLSLGKSAEEAVLETSKLCHECGHGVDVVHVQSLDNKPQGKTTKRTTK